MKALAFVAAATVTLGGTAKADSYSFFFNDGGRVPDVSGTFTTTSSGASELITQLTGTYRSSAITLDAPGVDIAAGGDTNDNLFYPGQTGTDEASGASGGYLDHSGLGFSSNGASYDLSFFDAANSYSYGLAPTSDNGVLAIGGTLSVTDLGPSVSAAPEPSTWLLLFGGIGGIGLMLRQAKRKIGFQFKDALAS